ncbi:MAG: hypothetical protein HFJ51_06885 [Clostridia bacterium]|nr:hypothetical protein [Clostridia bacterium]
MEILASIIELINAIIGLIGAGAFYTLLGIILLISIIVIILFIRKNIKRKIQIAHSQMVMCDKCEDIYFKMIKNYKSGGMKAEQFSHVILDELKEFLNQVSEMFTLITGKEIYSTLRFLETKKTINKSNVIMLQYSKNCERNRIEEFRKILRGEIKNLKVVERNTDFYEIIGDNRENRDPYFYEKDLKKYDKNLKKSHKKGYKNTTENWEQYYLGRVVVPIRAPNERLFFNDKTEGYDIIGFLTIDSKSKYAFSNKAHLKNFNLSILETYSAYLYMILSKYKYYLKRLGEKEGMI